jgi:hypothetical protein
MEWRVASETDDRTEWERADRFARVVLRRTATGEWAATLDLLEQAPEGPAYARETFTDRADAELRLASWREAHGKSDG